VDDEVSDNDSDVADVDVNTYENTDDHDVAADDDVVFVDFVILVGRVNKASKSTIRVMIEDQSLPVVVVVVWLAVPPPSNI
jgi:hypothetical protein